LFTLNSSHNTALVGLYQMNLYGPFFIYDWTDRTLGTIDNISWEGKIRSKNGYTHYRSVKQVGSSIIISDLVDNDYQILFHTPCDVRFTDGVAILSVGKRCVCKITCSGQMDLFESYRSVFYLKRKKTNCIVIKQSANSTLITEIIIN
jgi:hypothetical protein